MSTLTRVMLSIDRRRISAVRTSPDSRSIILVSGDMQRELDPVEQSVTTLSRHVSIRFFGIANWS